MWCYDAKTRLYILLAAVRRIVHQKNDGRRQNISSLISPQPVPVTNQSPAHMPIAYLCVLPSSHRIASNTRIQVMEEIYPSTPLHDQLLDQGNQPCML